MENQDENNSPYISEYKWHVGNQSANQIQVRGLFAEAIILQQNPEQRNEDYGNITWRAAYILSDYLKNKTDFLWRGKNVIELGCGTGLVGVTLAKLGKILCSWLDADEADTDGRSAMTPLLCAHATMTDVSHITELTATNIELNFSPGDNIPTLLELDWRRIEFSGIHSTFDFIVGSDLLQYDQVYDELVEVILKLSNDNTILLLGYEKRRINVEIRFFELIAPFFEIFLVDKEHLHPSFKDYKLRVFYGWKRKSPLAPTAATSIYGANTINSNILPTALRDQLLDPFE